MVKSEAQRPIDMAVVARVAQRVNLDEVTLIELQSERKAIPEGGLRMKVDHSHEPRVWGPNRIELVSTYEFEAHDENEEQILLGKVAFQLAYALEAGDALTLEDADQFARANGAFNSWPFLRALLHDLTARMGMPPYTLPTLLLRPKQTAQPETAADASPEPNT